jgi:hypothetical protein
MSLAQTAKAQLDAVRDRIPTDAYDAIAGALLLAERAELRTQPGGEATASELARAGEGFRRQPHLELGLPERRPETPTRDEDPTAVARRKAERRASERSDVEYGRARLIH